MRYLNSLLGIVGFILAFGAVGGMDFYDSIGKQATSEHWALLFIGLGMMLVSFIIHVLRSGKNGR